MIKVVRRPMPSEIRAKMREKPRDSSESSPKDGFWKEKKKLTHVRDEIGKDYPCGLVLLAEDHRWVVWSEPNLDGIIKILSNRY